MCQSQCREQRNGDQANNEDEERRRVTMKQVQYVCVFGFALLLTGFAGGRTAE